MRDSCEMRISHGIRSVPTVQLARNGLGISNADRAKGTFAAYLRYVSVFLEHDGASGVSTLGKTLRIGTLVTNEELCA